MFSFMICSAYLRNPCLCVTIFISWCAIFSFHHVEVLDHQRKGNIWLSGQ